MPATASSERSKETRCAITETASAAEAWVLAQRVPRAPNPGRKSSNYLQDCTICVSCRSAVTGFRRVTIAGIPESIGGSFTGGFLALDGGP